MDVGEAAHIRGARPGSARFDPAMTDEERAAITNGIWLCRSCAKLIDDNEDAYDVPLLVMWKDMHETSVVHTMRIPADGAGTTSRALIQLAASPMTEQEIARAVGELRSVAHDYTLQVVGARPGSIVLEVRATPAGCRHLAQAFHNGTLATIAGYAVLSARILGPGEDAISSQPPGDVAIAEASTRRPPSQRIVRNVGDDRVVDFLRQHLSRGAHLDIATPSLSLFALGELLPRLEVAGRVSLILPADAVDPATLVGDGNDRAARNTLEGRWFARRAMQWLRGHVEVRSTPEGVDQAAVVVSTKQGTATAALTGNCPITAPGLGLAPSKRVSLIQATEGEAIAAPYREWFQAMWSSLAPHSGATLASSLADLAGHTPPSQVYLATLARIFHDTFGAFEEEQVIRSATGIRDTVVWKKLYKFQRDGVVGAIDKLQRFGGCILADSVGLGKTFEALAVIKYHELRNDRVLVLCPKRLRDNWTLYRSNDRRNVLLADRLNYDVLNHTDLSREGGLSGDIDLDHVNWGNYDLVVIDESHNFRNKPALNQRDTRYEHLMNKVIKAGVKTRVLMLSATPVNNRIADLKNQIAFATEGDDRGLAHHGIASIASTTTLAQKAFNQWLKLDSGDRTAPRLLDMLGFDYFKLLDLLTIARSRKHVEKYYGTAETGRFPTRLAPINAQTEVDTLGAFRSIREISDEIRRLTLAAYAPLRYVLPGKLKEYDAKYSTVVRGGKGTWRQVDREESMVNLLRVNVLKRMESSVIAFALTVERQFADVDRLLERLQAGSGSVDELSIEDVDVDDPTYETLLVGRKVKVLLQDVDRLRWCQDLQEDRNRLATLLSAAAAVSPDRDAKLQRLKELIREKCARPINPGNRKVIVFTAFADTAEYLYTNLAGWARQELGVHAALVTGGGANRSNLSGLRAELSSVLTAFSPRAKERPADLAEEGDLDLLIATDCISEGQNLQDCDFLVNYDIHWNPVRIIQRFGRIDRIGSTNERIQLVNFWPNIELEAYINLESRVRGKMVLLDISATGEENIIDDDGPAAMNDLEYRRKQLLRLQDAVIDLEDLSGGISITDLTFNDFRMDLAGVSAEERLRLRSLPLGIMGVVPGGPGGGDGSGPGAIFCLRAETPRALAAIEPGYPLAPYFLVYVGAPGTVELPHAQARQALDRLRRLSVGRDAIDVGACSAFDLGTHDGKDMSLYTEALARAVASIVGRREERAVESLFRPGGTHALEGEFPGVDDFEVVAWMAITGGATPYRGET
ncbi:SNF2-related protein [Myxococcota bacterium]|nr:SNF2-related protein [Myxococcota bacterium]